MKFGSIGFFIALCTISILLTGCRKNLLRYGNRASCLGTFNEGQNIRGYPVPLIPSYSGMEIVWDDSSELFVLRDYKGILHTIDQVDGEDVEQIFYTPWRGSTFDLSEDFNLVTGSVGESETAIVYVYSLNKETPKSPLSTIQRTRSPNFHPHELLLAGIHYPDGYEHGSNVIGVFDLKGLDPVLARVYELDDTAINEVFGWSSSGEVIAVSQDSEIGTIPHYIFSRDDVIKRSLFSISSHSCVVDGQWSPDEEIIAFSGVNEALKGWDLFLETVVTPGSEGNSLINLTNSPHEDERSAAWSPSGEKITFTKAYEDQSGNLRQELVLINLNDDALGTIQLTDSPDEFKTNPMWLSDSEIAYLGWKPAEGNWLLNILSITETIPTKRLVLEIPQSWFR